MAFYSQFKKKDNYVDFIFLPLERAMNKLKKTHSLEQQYLRPKTAEYKKFKPFTQLKRVR